MPTLHEALLTYLQMDRSPQTRIQYQSVLTRLVRDIGPQRDVTIIRYEDLVDYFDRLRQRGLKQITLKSYLNVVRTFFTWCVRRQYILVSPAEDLRVRTPTRDPNQHKAIPPDELTRMVEYARITSPRNHAILLFLADTGCRVGGLVSLTIPNLHIDEQWALLHEKGGKYHRAFFGEETRHALEVWLSKRPDVSHDFVWTGPGTGYEPLGRAAVSALVRRIAIKTDASKAWGPHSVRHAVGWALAKRGVPVTVTQRKLGHSNPNVTMEFYYPDEEAYVIEVSRRHSLAALEQPDQPEEPPELPRIVHRKGAG
ncbi:MAG: hypothetical protein CL610_06205 [Anaerolineaceae bacterium]|nr:hypothetical protein [Anaerolineaceae bacterium]